MSLTAKTKVLAVLGDPVGHSLSPLMHNGWIGDHGIDAVYVALRVSDDASAFFAGLKSAGFHGVNVTVPHKELAARAADRSGLAVANTLRWAEDGVLEAFNTDGTGFTDALEDAAPGWRARVKSILILGAGGGARGIAETLQGDARMLIANRTRARAEDLALSIKNAEAADWADLPVLFAQADLIVQTTTLGMGGNVSPAWPVAHCKAGAIIVDIVYRPLETPLLKAARARGLVGVDGLGMLIHQGARAFEIWFGVKPDTSKARERLMAALKS